jgi:hypothetical protein
MAEMGFWTETTRAWFAKGESMKRTMFFVLPIPLLLFACTDTIQGKSVAEAKVAAFHERLNAGQYEEIYSEAGDEFRNVAPKEKVLTLFSAIDNKLGKVKSSSTKTWNVKTYNFVTTVVLVVDTQFERGVGTESFTFRVSGDKATLLGYNINSLDMMTR